MAGSREDGHRITDRCQGESEPAARPGAATQQLISLTVAPDTARWLLSPPWHQGGECPRAPWLQGVLAVCTSVFSGSSSPGEPGRRQHWRRQSTVESGPQGGVWLPHLTLGKFLKLLWNSPGVQNRPKCQLWQMTPVRRKVGEEIVSDFTEPCLEGGNIQSMAALTAGNPRAMMGPETPPASESSSGNPGHPVRPFPASQLSRYVQSFIKH